jgi:hypothetical protein
VASVGGVMSRSAQVLGIVGGLFALVQTGSNLTGYNPFERSRTSIGLTSVEMSARKPLETSQPGSLDLTISFVMWMENKGTGNDQITPETASFTLSSLHLSETRSKVAFVEQEQEIPLTVVDRRSQKVVRGRAYFESTEILSKAKELFANGQGYVDGGLALIFKGKTKYPINACFVLTEEQISNLVNEEKTPPFSQPGCTSNGENR